MKKILFLLSAAIMLFASCEGPAGRDGYDGEDGKDFSFHNAYFTIESRDWERVSVGRYATLYKCVRDVDIREEAYERGMVLASIFQWDENDNEVKTLLPFWVQHTDGDNTWLEGYYYDYDHGTVAFYVECRNGTTPPRCEFHVFVAP